MIAMATRPYSIHHMRCCIMMHNLGPAWWSAMCMTPQCYGESGTHSKYNAVKALSDVIFDMENNTFISFPQSLKCKQGVHNEQPEENTEIDIRSTARRISYWRDTLSNDASGTDESMAHGHTQATTGTGETMSHGRADEVARWPVAGNHAAAGANPDLPLTGHSTNGHGDWSPPASGVNNGHTHTHGSWRGRPHTHRQWTQQSLSNPRISSSSPIKRQGHHTKTIATICRGYYQKIKKSPSTNRQSHKKQSKYTAMLSPLKKQWETMNIEESNSVIQNGTFSWGNLHETISEQGQSYWNVFSRLNEILTAQHDSRQARDQRMWADVLWRNILRNNCIINHLNVVTPFRNLDIDDDALLMELLEGWPHIEKTTLSGKTRKSKWSNYKKHFTALSRRHISGTSILTDFSYR